MKNICDMRHTLSRFIKRISEFSEFSFLLFQSFVKNFLYLLFEKEFFGEYLSSSEYEQ
jgi:hypothetical protein